MALGLLIDGQGLVLDYAQALARIVEAPGVAVRGPWPCLRGLMGAARPG